MTQPPVSLPVGEHGTLRHEALFKKRHSAIANLRATERS